MTEPERHNTDETNDMGRLPSPDSPPSPIENHPPPIENHQSSIENPQPAPAQSEIINHQSKITVLIVDDHALVRQGIRALLSVETDIEIVGEADDGAAAVEMCRQLRPDVVLMDLTMPGRGGLRATEDLRRVCPEVKVLVLTMHDDEAYARQALVAGAAGYVLKKSVAGELIRAIRSVHAGQRHVAESLASAVDSPAIATARQRRGRGRAVDLLTPREREVVGLVAMGLTNAQVAARLRISPKTVETHRMHIIGKLALQTRADLVRFAIENELMQA